MRLPRTAVAIVAAAAVVVGFVAVVSRPSSPAGDAASPSASGLPVMQVFSTDG